MLTFCALFTLFTGVIVLLNTLTRKQETVGTVVDAAVGLTLTAVGAFAFLKAVGTAP